MLHTKWLSLSCLVLVLGASGTARAADFYVDPAAGDMQNDGSEQHPWRTLQEVIEADLIETQQWDHLPYEQGEPLVPRNAGAPVKAGDTIWLRSGYHGDILIGDAYNTADITIAAESGQTPRIRTLHVLAASHWIIRGLSISLSHAPSYDVDNIVFLDENDFRGPTDHIVVEDCDVFSVDDVSGWSLSDWNDLPGNGVTVKGDDCTIRGNRIRNVDFGISISGERGLVDHNTVDRFAGDGMRGLGDYGTFQYNTVKNCYDVNENHDDGFQSWSVGPDGHSGGGEVVGITLRGNTIINYEDPNQPFRGPLQGIGCFDGMFVDWVVENNVIITDHWHGITLMGARNTRIVNNTVLDPNDVDPGPPWIRISAHKNGTPSEGCVVRNNLTTKLNIEDGQDVVEDHNIILGNYAEHFVDPAGFDLHLLAGSSAVDTGSPDLAPAADRDEIARPQGAAIDVGAYEYYEGDPTKPDAGPEAGTLDATPSDADLPDGTVADGGLPDGAGGGTADAGMDSGNGGAGGSTGGTGGSAGGSSGGSAAANDAAGDDGGCGCSQIPTETPFSWRWGAIGIVAALAWGRRRERFVRPKSAR